MQTGEDAPCGLFSFSDSGKLIQVNLVCSQLLGKDKEALLGKHVEIILSLPAKIFFQTHFIPLVKMHGHAEEIFLNLLTASNEYLPVLLNARRQEGDSAVTHCAFIHVPNRKKFEDELVKARKEAERALLENSELISVRNELKNHSIDLDKKIQRINRQNSELKQLNHVITHNLREPIRKISLYQDKIRYASPLNEGLTDFDRLRKATLNLKGILSGLQQYVWLEEAESDFTKIDLNVILKQVLDDLSAERDNFELTYSGLVPIEADVKQMRTLFSNIISNAIKFRRDSKAKIEVSGKIIKRNVFRASDNRYRYEDFLRITFKDHGIGFDMTYSDQIFDLFKRLHYIEGQGIGLALSKKIVDNHSGEIAAESEIEKFTIITIDLPLIKVLSN